MRNLKDLESYVAIKENVTMPTFIYFFMLVVSLSTTWSMISTYDLTIHWWLMLNIFGILVTTVLVLTITKIIFWILG